MAQIDVYTPEYMGRLHKLDTYMRALHDEADEYHGYDIHPRGETLPHSRRLALACIAAGINIDMAVTDCGSLGHDALTTQPLVGHDYASREERAADATAAVMDVCGFNYRTGLRASNAIIATARHEDVYFPEDGVLVEADTVNVGGPYAWFLRRCEDYRLECERTWGQAIEIGDWLADTPPILEDFCFKRLPGEMNQVADIRVARHEKRLNIEALKRETPENYATKLAKMPMTAASLLVPEPIAGLLDPARPSSLVPPGIRLPSFHRS